MRRLFLLALCALAAGCGAQKTVTVATTTAPRVPAPDTRLAVGVIGPLEVAVPGTRVRTGERDAPLVLVDASRMSALDASQLAAEHPASHYVLVGGSVADAKRANLVGLVLREDEASYLAGVAAGLVATDQGAVEQRVAWVGPEERKLAAAFGRGVHAVAPGVAVLHQWSRAIPARCKEAALIGLDRGATVVMAHRGTCATAAEAAAHQQNLPALRLADFELPAVAAEAIVRDAVNGLYHGGEDLVFGVQSGAVGVRRLDPRIPLATAAKVRASAQSLSNGIPAAG